MPANNDEVIRVGNDPGSILPPFVALPPRAQVAIMEMLVSSGLMTPPCGVPRVLRVRRGHAAAALAWTRAVMTRIGLTLNDAKTSIRNARTETFDFLGYTLGIRRSGDPHVRFDERESETEPCAGLRHRRLRKQSVPSYSPTLPSPRRLSTLRYS